MHASAALVMSRRRAVMGNGAERPTDRHRHHRHRRRPHNHRSRDSHRRRHLRLHLLLHLLNLQVQASEFACECWSDVPFSDEAFHRRDVLQPDRYFALLWLG